MLPILTYLLAALSLLSSDPATRVRSASQEVVPHHRHLSNSSVRTKAIDKLTAQIDHPDSAAKIIHKELLTGTDGGGDFTALMMQKKVRRVAVVVNLSSKTVTKRFYYDSHSHLILAVVEKRRYSWNPASGILDLSKPVLGSRVKYYFAEGRLFHSQFTGKDDGGGQSGKEIYSEAVLFTNAAKSAGKQLDIEAYIRNG